MRRPSLADTLVDRGADAVERRAVASTADWPTPVGARYSPNTRRSVAPHSPVVTPALAQAIDGSMMLRPSLAARSRSARAAFTALASRSARQALRRSTCCGLDGGIDDHDGAFAGGQRRRLGLGPPVDADDDLLAGFDAGAAAPVLLSTRRRFM